MNKDLERLLTYCPATDKKANQILNQGNKLVGYIFKDGETYRTCAFGSVRNSISQKEWEGLTFPNQPSYEPLERELVELKAENLKFREELSDLRHVKMRLDALWINHFELMKKAKRYKKRLAEFKEVNRWQSQKSIKERSEDFTDKEK